MFEFDVDVGKGLDAPSKRKIYDMLIAKARPELLKAEDVCLLGLCNWRYGEWLRDEFPNIKKVTVIESKQLRFMYRDLESLEAYNIVYVEDKKYVEVLKGLMKFDCIIMNPPYDGQLHRKILAEAIKHSNNVVCLAPSLYTNYKNEKNFEMLPSTFEIIDTDEAEKLFDNIQLQDVLLITTWNNTSHISKDEIYRNFIPTGYNIIKKIKTIKTLDDVNILNFSNEKYFVPLKLMTARWDKNKDIIIDKLGLLINGYTLNNIYYKDARSKNKDRPCGGIAFNSEKEAINFINSCNTTFFKFIVKMLHTNSRYILKEYPFMGDYTQPWTDERFYKFFNITPEEQKTIEATMAKYK